MNEQERFWSKVDKQGSPSAHAPELGPCWVWTASLTAYGYGQFGFRKRVVRAHRVAYELSIGPIPQGLELDHLCRVHECVNPSHLEPVTHKTNMSRGFFRLKTHCPQGHPYDADNTYVLNGERFCRACRHEYKTGRARVAS
jgi:hypothetical protein